MGTFWEIPARSVSNLFSLFFFCLFVIFIYFPFWFYERDLLFAPVPVHCFSITFKVAPKLCIFLYNTMETTFIRQGMCIMHLDVMETVYHSGDACDSMP